MKKKTNMTTNKYLYWLVSGAVAAMLQSCAIPNIMTKEADTALPAQYSGKAAAADTQSSASVSWKEFFQDKNLVSLIDTAVANNKEIQMMAQRISMAQNEIQARRGAYLPFVNAGGGINYEKTSKFTRLGAVEDGLKIHNQSFPTFLGDYQFGLVASWEVDIWHKLRNAQQVAVLDYMATTEGKSFLVTNLVAEVANSYYELVALDNQLLTLQKNIEIQQNALNVIRELQKYARSTSLAVKRFEAEVKKNQSKQYVIKQQITEAENRINMLLGRTSQPIARNSDGFMELQPKAVETGLPSQMLANRPDIRRSELELAAAKLNIDVARANFYPSFTMNAGLGFQAFKPQYLLNIPDALGASLGAGLMGPLINRNAIIAEYKNASASQIEKAYEYEQTIINAYMEVANQIANVDNLSKNFSLKTDQVNQLTQSIDVANQLFKNARADYGEVLLTQRDALDAKMELIDTKQQQMSAMINLYRSLGGGWR